jgi:CRISPR-associated protein Cas1
MLNEFTYCPRLFYLEWVHGEFAENLDVLEGKIVHRRTERESGSLPRPGAEELEMKEAGFSARAVLLSGEKCGVIAKIDLVDAKDGKVQPVDYKKGVPPDGGAGVWEPDRVQLIAQVAILREAGYECQSGILYYAGVKRRIEVQVTDKDLSMLENVISQARSVAGSDQPPPPLEDSPKCPRCSLVGICLPDETRALSEEETDGGPPARFTDVRRMYPARDDALPAYVQEQGATIHKNGEVLEVRKGGDVVDRVRLTELSQISVFGNVSLTPSAIHTSCERGIPICHFSYGGWFYGMTTGMSHKNVHLRMAQFSTAADPVRSMQISRRFVEGKIRNCRTLLRRNYRGDCSPSSNELKRLAELTARTSDPNELMGLEGAAARVYFAAFHGMLDPDCSPEGVEFDFQSRNRRPPRDPINCLLSLLYAVLCKDVTVTLASIGFDPYLGFFHRPKYGRPSLALDIMEEFRPLIADSIVVTLVNNKMLTANDFIQRGPAWSLTGEGRRAVLGAYERRMDALISHPLFGYSLSYRRVLEVQGRLLSRHLMGEVPSYQPFCTR